MEKETKDEIVWKNRRELTVLGVKELLRFDDSSAEFYTLQGNLFVSGEGIHVGAMDLEKQTVVLVGDRIDTVEYLNTSAEASTTGWKRWFCRS